MKIKSLILLILISYTNSIYSAPTHLTQKVVNDGETITLKLTRVNIRGNHFEVLSRDGNGNYSPVNVAAERSYIGTVDEYQGAVSCGILRDDGTFWGKVYFKRGLTWVIQDTAVDKPLLPYTKTPETFAYPYFGLEAGQIGDNTFSYDVGVEISNSFFEGRAESDLATTLEMIEFSTVTTAAIYLRDLQLRPYLGRIIIYTKPNKDKFYDTYTGVNIVKQYLDKVEKDWKENHSDSNWDMFVVVSDKLKLPNSPMTSAFGGLATLNGAACGSGGNGNFGLFWRHEMAHSWGLGHYDGSVSGQGPEGYTINSGNGYSRFSGPEVQLILNRRDSELFSITHEGIFTAVNLPPYAALDDVEFRHGLDKECIIDVLSNDHDINGENLSIIDFDQISENGGEVRNIGDQLYYTAAADFSGVDIFRYTIEDESGQTAEGVVLVNVYQYEYNRLHLPLDENSGDIANDISIYKNNGVVGGTNFSKSSVSGSIGRGLDLNGTSDYIDVEGVILDPDTVTFTMWIKPNASQATNLSGLIFNNQPSRSGLCINKDNELAYIWNGEGDGDAWNSGLIVPANKWTFVALVVNPSNATIYMDSGSGLKKAVNKTTHNLDFAAFTTLRIGGYPGWEKRFYGGAIDDVQIYAKTLSIEELQIVTKGNIIVFDGKTSNTDKKIKLSQFKDQFQYNVFKNIITYKNRGDKTSIKLLSSRGRVIISKLVSGKQSGCIDLSKLKLSNGFYLLSIESLNQSTQRGILKVN